MWFLLLLVQLPKQSANNLLASLRCDGLGIAGRRVLEGLVLGVACANPKEFNQSKCSPKDAKTDKVMAFQNWSLAQFIEVACEKGYLQLDVKKFSHELRDFRNYIHPYEQMASGFKPDEHTARICLQVLRAAIASLSNQRTESGVV